jgi:hypothetical protein
MQSSARSALREATVTAAKRRARPCSRQSFFDPACASVRQGAVAHRLSEGLHALSEADGAAHELIRNGPGLTAAECGSICISDLTEHLLLCQNSGVEPSGDEHHPLRRGEPPRPLHGRRDIGQVLC